ncbi:uncharacterized protein LOC122009966 [Zingiber officinale]|uniref:uncharacterized protein LOC122009966 n=1 Tax=Zingiber officinale TaxID=94328 RepID=UPI001C4D41F8|nr:uncharacterized protein LOC122009966 [Zingiber officinale]XP_042422223.1 uncharacterized protein LOC122009966 [Zingiber officinale]XP_042422224.1 uncharacterized protein LOC122009966 [Zingiber officinale]
MATDQQQITLKVFVNKTNNCVAFVESDSDFVDVLLSFLTLPVGTVVRLLNKQSSMGCFDKLYQSVEQLDEKYLVTAACRSMLTNPVNSSGMKCQKLRINIDEMGKLYTCSSANCYRLSYSYYSGLKCQCGGSINKAVSYELNRDGVNYEEFHGVFVKGAKFVVTDALCIAFVTDLISTLNECGNDDCNHMEERLVKIEREQVLHILKRSLISNTPLTDVLLHNGEDMTTPKVSVPSIGKTVERKAFDEEKKIYKLNMVLTRNKVLYAGASQDFVDLIFSFLTFPLGSLKRHLGSRFRIGCLNNLYGSAERLRSSGFVVAGCEERLLNPKLAPYFNCKNQVIGLEEEKQVIYYTCNHCCKLSTTRYCCILHEAWAEQATLIDPKGQPGGTISSRGSYCQELMYMVTDELVVTPLSLTEVISFRKEISDPIMMAELSVAEGEVHDFLVVALTSKTALTDAFLASTVGVLTSMGVKGE